jgi:hypothetical protein
MFSSTYRTRQSPFRQAGSLVGRLLAPFDALYPRILLGLVVMMQVVRQRPMTNLPDT